MLEKNSLRYVFPDHVPPFATIFTSTSELALTLPPLFIHRLATETFLTFNRECEEEQQMALTICWFMPDLYFCVEVLLRRHGTYTIPFATAWHPHPHYTLQQHRPQQLWFASSLMGQDIPETFSIWLHSCWQVEPHKRYQDGRDLCTGLWSVPSSVEKLKIGLKDQHCAWY